MWTGTSGHGTLLKWRGGGSASCRIGELCGLKNVRVQASNHRRPAPLNQRSQQSGKLDNEVTDSFTKVNSPIEVDGTKVGLPDFRIPAELVEKAVFTLAELLKPGQGHLDQLELDEFD